MLRTLSLQDIKRLMLTSNSIQHFSHTCLPRRCFFTTSHLWSSVQCQCLSYVIVSCLQTFDSILFFSSNLCSAKGFLFSLYNDFLFQPWSVGAWRQLTWELFSGLPWEHYHYHNAMISPHHILYHHHYKHSGGCQLFRPAHWGPWTENEVGPVWPTTYNLHHHHLHQQSTRMSSNSTSSSPLLKESLQLHLQINAVVQFYQEPEQRSYRH